MTTGITSSGNTRNISASFVCFGLLSQARRKRPANSGSAGFDRPEGRALFEDQIEIAKINEEPHTLSQDENRVALVDRISQQNDSATDAEIPERHGDDAAPFAFALPALNQKA